MSSNGSKVSRPFAQLALTNLRELVRDPMTFFFILVFPFLFILIFYLISHVTSPAAYAVGLEVPIDADPKVEQLRSILNSAPTLTVRQLSATEGGELLDKGELDVLVTLPPHLDQEPIAVLAGKNGSAAATLVRNMLAEATRGPAGATITVAGMEDQTEFDPLKFGIPAILIMAFSSLAFFGTASPLIQLRQRGTLRLLGMTPLSRLTFLTAQIPARFSIGILQLLLMLGFAKASGFLATQHLFAALVSAVLGLLMLFALGYLIGGIFSSAEVANGILAGSLPLMLMFTGVMLPLDMMPSWIRTAAQYIPLTYFGDAIRQTLIGAEPMFPLGVNYLVMVGTTVVLTALAVVTFRWDQGEAR